MTYTPRLSAPSYLDKRWIKTTFGGYNQCIIGSDGGDSVLPNCTGYVHGRWMELAGSNSDTLGLAFTNANYYWTYSDQSLARGSEPQLGACVCYANRDGGAGHVAIVEEIASDGSYIITSESNWGAERFVLRTRRRDNDWSWYTNPQTVFQGFIYHPNISPTPPEPPDPPEPPTPVLPTIKKKTSLWWKYLTVRRSKGFFIKLKSKRKRSVKQWQLKLVMNC